MRYMGRVDTKLGFIGMRSRTIALMKLQEQKESMADKIDKYKHRGGRVYQGS
jgi:hypothetical protein